MKILLFVGPPKTASTYLYGVLEKSNQDVLIPNGWQWPKCPNSTKRYEFKQFGAFPEALIGDGPPFKYRHCPSLDGPEKFLGYYKELLYTNYHAENEDGVKGIAFGSEYFPAFFTLRDETTMLNNLLTLLPWNRHVKENNFHDMTFQDPSNRDSMIRAVIMYRTPRLSHLMSKFKENKVPSVHKKNTGVEIIANRTFSQFLCKRKILNSYTFDPLNLAALFVKHNLPVTLVDMAGVQNDGFDVVDTVLCDLMGISSSSVCQNGKFIGKQYYDTTSSDTVIKTSKLKGGSKAFNDVLKKGVKGSLDRALKQQHSANGTKKVSIHHRNATRATTKQSSTNNATLKQHDTKRIIKGSTAKNGTTVKRHITKGTKTKKEGITTVGPGKQLKTFTTGYFGSAAKDDGGIKAMTTTTHKKSPNKTQKANNNYSPAKYYRKLAEKKQPQQLWSAHNNSIDELPLSSTSTSLDHLVHFSLAEQVEKTMEDIFAALDCHYQDILENNPLVEISHQHQLFQRCQDINRTLTSVEAFTLIHRVGCAAQISEFYNKTDLEKIAILVHTLERVSFVLNGHEDVFPADSSSSRKNNTNPCYIPTIPNSLYPFNMTMVFLGFVLYFKRRQICTRTKC